MNHLKVLFFILLTNLLGLPLSSAQSALFNTPNVKVQKFKNKRAINKTHKAYLGKMVFDTERIVFKTKKDQFSNSFDWSNELYFREFWPVTMEEAYKDSFGGGAKDNAALLYQVDVNGHTVELPYYHHTGKENAQTWYTNWGVLKSESKNIRGHLYNTMLSKALTKSSNYLKSNNEIVIKSYIYDIKSERKGQLLAQGSIQLTISNPSSIQAAPTNNRYPDCMPSPEMTDQALEKAFLDEIKSQGWQETHHNVVINTDDFTVIRNSLTSIIEGRNCGAFITAKRGDKCFYQNFTFYQAHDGNSFTGKWSLKGIGSQQSIACNCIKK